MDQNECGCPSSDIYIHCHQSLGQTALNCKVCSNTMELDAHLYRCQFGGPRAELRSLYFCSPCNQQDGVALYDGPPVHDVSALIAEKFRI